jgi:hypothetical protein
VSVCGYKQWLKLNESESVRTIDSDGIIKWKSPNGILHREDGPAVEHPYAYKSWYINGKRHREDGPAVEYSNGDKEWYINGEIHREDGPAVEYPSGYKEWYINGKRHREDGPAVECSNGDNAWYINGKELTEKEFERYIVKYHLQSALDEIGLGGLI